MAAEAAVHEASLLLPLPSYEDKARRSFFDFMTK
jgi:hypothetical protein